MAGKKETEKNAKEVRLLHCNNCNNMIAKTKDIKLSGQLSIKCEKCGTFNTINK